MKIAFSGSGGTGKTTLLKELNKTMHYPVINEGVREWLRLHKFNDFKEMNTNDIKQMQLDVLNKKIQLENFYKRFIVDRTTIDNFCYALRWIGSESSEHNDFMSNYFKRCMEHVKTYDLIFICPWNAFKIEDDGIRSNKKWYQYMIQSLIEYHLYGLLLNNEKVKIHKIQEVELTKRINECIMVINDLSLANFKNYEQKEPIILNF